MPKLHPSLSPAIRDLSEKEKEKIILRFARANAEMNDILSYELLEEVTLESLQQESEDTIQELLFNLSGRSVYKGLSRAITKAIKEIARVKKVTKNPKLEIDLLVYLLSVLFDSFSEHLDNSNRSFPTKTARITLRLHNLILKNLHPDLRLEYKTQLDEWLHTLHARASKYPIMATLPQELPE